MREILVNRVIGACRQGGIKTISERLDKGELRFDGPRVYRKAEDYDPTGLLKFDRMATGLELKQVLNEALKEAGLYNKTEDGFSCWRPGELPKNVSRLACYASTGGSEGYYVAIDALVRSNNGSSAWSALPILYTKTFAGLDTAFECAQLAVQVLEQ
ncbi:MAG: hypothetical protein ACYSW8_18715 [Planctomycetota bacterium]|jgi:hypothetical protein